MISGMVANEGWDRSPLLRGLPYDGAADRGAEAQMPYMQAEDREQAARGVQGFDQGLLAAGAEAHDDHSEREEGGWVETCCSRGRGGSEESSILFMFEERTRD